jgi:hypothetical protein
MAVRARLMAHRIDCITHPGGAAAEQVCDSAAGTYPARDLIDSTHPMQRSRFDIGNFGLRAGEFLR